MAYIGGKEAGSVTVTVLGARRGDIDRDGEADLADAVLLMRYLLGEDVLDDAQGALADLDGNGRLNAADLTQLKRLLLRG